MSKPIYEQRQSPEGGLVALKEKPSDLMKRTSTKVIDYAGNPDFVKKFNTSSRDFPGATTSRKKGAYGPAMNYSTTSDKMGDGGFTNASSTGDASGSAVTESSVEKFITFIESLRTDNNARLLETVVHGFCAIAAGK